MVRAVIGMRDVNTASPELMLQPPAQFVKCLSTIVTTRNAGLVRHDDNAVAPILRGSAELKNALDKFEVLLLVHGTHSRG